MRKDYMELSNRLSGHSPYEVVSNNVEGEVNMKPDGRTDVAERGSINPLHPAIQGNFGVNTEALQDQRELIRNGFYGDTFSQFGSMTGDRRTTLEIQLRYQEGLRQLVSPVSRFESEDFTPQLSRVISELIRAGRIPAPPPELRGQSFAIEYMGELAMAMRDLQSRGFERGMLLMGQMSTVFPDVRDEINLGRVMPDILLNYGMKVEHLNTPEEKQVLQQQRAEAQQKIEQMQAAQVAADAYGKGTKAPEEGSGTQKIMEGMGIGK
jgi:hypothetical protein